MRLSARVGSMVAAACLTGHWVIVAQEGASKYRPLPLGKEVGAEAGDRLFAVYIPTRLGGKLTITTGAGEVGAIASPHGRAIANGQELGTSAQGWYTLEVTGATQPYKISASLVQSGQSMRRPWNFYYWPTKADTIHEPWSGGNGRVDTFQVYGDDVLVSTPAGPIAPGQDIVLAGPNGILETPVAPGDDSTWFPNLDDDSTFRGADGSVYATPSPLLKYDTLFRTSARGWEGMNGQDHDIKRWPGHCLGGAVASILLEEPVPSPASGLSRDELKALWAELGENHRNHRIGESVTDIPAGPPRPGPDPCDRSVARFHRILEEHVCGGHRALLGNLRAFPPRGEPEEVWNHGIGRYVARYHANEGLDNHTVRLEVEIEANSGSSLNGQDDQPRRIRYEYIVAYDAEGRVDESRSDACDWIAVAGDALYAPLNLMEVLATRWAGHNPYVLEANVRSIDLANGGSTRLATNPVAASSTANRSRNQTVANRTSSISPPRRVGLGRLLGQR